MTHQQIYQQHLNRLSNSHWNGVSRRRAKGKSGNSGIVARNGQIGEVYMEAIFNKPNWTKYQR